MFDSLKKVAGSDLEQYIHKKRVVFNVASQITDNRLVRELSDAYYDIEQSLQQNATYSKVKEFYQKDLHPAIEPTLVDIGRGVACRDVLVFIETGAPMLPEGLIESLVFIQENNLIERIRAEVTKLPSPEEEGRKKQEEAKRKAFEQDLANLEEQLRQAKNELGAAAKVQRDVREQRVKNIEEAISDLKKSGEPLNSIMWT